MAAETATYAQATKEVTVTINKANAVAATVTANNRTYDGTEKPLVTVTGEATGGTMQYALGTATEATEQYTTPIPAETNAGTYYVWYKVEGDPDHTDSAPSCIQVHISTPYYPPSTPSTPTPTPKPTGSVTGDSTIPENTFIDPSTTISDEEAKELLTEEEKKAVENGENINIYLEAKEMSEAQVPAQDKAEIDAQAESNGITVASYSVLILQSSSTFRASDRRS